MKMEQECGMTPPPPLQTLTKVYQTNTLKITPISFGIVCSTVVQWLYNACTSNLQSKGYKLEPGPTIAVLKLSSSNRNNE